jgi:hypothetical protein
VREKYFRHPLGSASTKIFRQAFAQFLTWSSAVMQFEYSRRRTGAQPCAPCETSFRLPLTPVPLVQLLVGYVNRGERNSRWLEQHKE